MTFPVYYAKVAATKVLGHRSLRITTRTWFARLAKSEKH